MRSVRVRARRRWLPGALRGGVAVLRPSVDEPGSSYLKGLEEYGYVILHDRALPGGRLRVEHLVIGPTGVHAVETKPWPGQLAAEGDRLYVDGRRRDGTTDGAAKLASAIQDLLVADLKPLGLQVVPHICFPRSEAPLFSRRIGGVVVSGGRGLARSIRDGQPALNAEQALALALMADEVLEPASRRT